MDLTAIPDVSLEESALIAEAESEEEVRNQLKGLGYLS